MAKAGDKTEVGEIVNERKALDHPFFPVTERCIVNQDGTRREPQLLWDRRGREFVIGIMRTVDAEFVVIRQPKYGQMKRMLSFPTGGVKKNESREDAVDRESAKESGYRPLSWTLLRETPVVDFADKIDGGEHFFYFGDHAVKIGEPEENTEVLLLSGLEVQALIVGRGKEHGVFEIAMQMIAFVFALRHYSSL